MQKQILEGRASGSLAAVWLLAAALLVAVYVLLCPARALAAEEVAYSIDGTGNRTSYASVSDAIDAGCSDAHPTIVMAKDWEVSGVLTIPEGKKLTIDMYGNVISSLGGMTPETQPFIDVRKGAELTLKSSMVREITYKGFDLDSDQVIDVTTNTGGLVTEGAPAEEPARCPILASESSTVNLEGVTIGGNWGHFAGGVGMNKSATLSMSKGASIEYNRGHGVRAYEGGQRIDMDNASISYNSLHRTGGKFGGGIMVSHENTCITMTNGSKIDHNRAFAGGGIYYSLSKFKLVSPDGTGAISSNAATKSDRLAMKTEQSGGGIHVDQRKYGANEGLIEGITISGNYSAYDGGGLELDQESTVVKNCTITGNTAYYEGGGAYVCNDDNSFEGCTVTGNACNLAGKNYEGGGVYVWCDYDVKLAGLCLIYGNTRGQNSGNADDLFLRENVGATAKAYVTGGVSQGSHVGIRTGITGDRMVGKGIKNESKDCFFADLGGYYVSYGNDHNGDMWQRHAVRDFALRLGGRDAGRYAYGSAVTLNGASASADKVFWHWDAEPKSTTGLYPVADYITADNAYSPLLSFAMPQNDVDVSAVYADRVKRGTLAVEAPAAGEELPSTAAFARADDGVGGAQALGELTVTWYEVAADGSRAAAAGAAKAGASYVASVSVEQQPALGLFFDAGISASEVAVNGAGPAASASVDAATGTLTVETSAFRTEGEGGGEAAGTVTLRLENGGLMGAGLPEAGAAAMAAGDGEGAGLSEKVNVSYAEGSGSVTVTAPVREGYNFNHWEGVPGSVAYDDEAGTVTFAEGDLTEGLELTAVYAPVVTELDLGIDAPAAGKKLAGTASSMKVKCSDGTEFDLLSGMTGGESVPVSWSPEATKAAGATRYTAVVDLDDGEGYVDVDKVLAQDATVKTNGADSRPASGFAVQNGRLVFYATFSATEDVNAAAAKAVKGKVKAVKAGAKTGKTVKAKALKVEAPASADGTKASFELVSGPKLVKLDVKTGKVTLKKGAKRGKSYKAKVKVTYGDASKKVTVKFKVK